MFANFDNGGGTDWAQKSVPEMWSMLVAHDGTAHKELLLTWKRSAELLVDHLSRVKRYRENLAEAWPPEKSRAAAKYLDRLDDLIKHLSETYHATVENHRALGAATSALVGARLKLEAIHREYTANQQDLDTYAIRQRSYQETVSKYRGPVPTPPDASASRQLDLQLQAQSLMSTLSTDLAQAQLNITTPNLYNPVSNIDRTEPFKPGEPTGLTTNPSSSIANPSDRSSTARRAPSGISSISPKGSISSPPKQPDQLDSPPGPLTPQPATSQPSGPTLSGISPTEALPKSPSIESKTTGSGKFSTTGIYDSIPVLGTTPTAPLKGITRPDNGFSERSTSERTSRAQGTLPGGLIGGLPGANGSHPRTSSARTRRVNPIGGVIGGHQGATSSTMNPRREVDSPEKKSRDERWDPDNPWATEEGIAPIITPPEKREIDPGPALGLP